MILSFGTIKTVIRAQAAHELNEMQTMLYNLKLNIPQYDEPLFSGSCFYVVYSSHCVSLLLRASCHFAPLRANRIKAS